MPMQSYVQAGFTDRGAKEIRRFDEPSGNKDLVLLFVYQRTSMGHKTQHEVRVPIGDQKAIAEAEGTFGSWLRTLLKRLEVEDQQAELNSDRLDLTFVKPEPDEAEAEEATAVNG